MELNQAFPILGPMLEAGLYDPHDAPLHTNWSPWNREAAEMASCIEASKQITLLKPLFSSGGSSRRMYTLLATPVHSLTEHILSMQKMLASRERVTWLESDRRAFVEIPRILRKQVKPLKRLRDKLSAHCDIDAVRPGSNLPVVDSAIVLNPLHSSLVLLILALNHNGTFSYFRLPDPLNRREVQIFVEYPLATLFRVDGEGKPVEILEVRIVTDPRHEAARVIREAIATYNSIASASTPTLQQIEIIEREGEKLNLDELRVRIL